MTLLLSILAVLAFVVAAPSALAAPRYIAIGFDAAHDDQPTAALFIDLDTLTRSGDTATVTSVVVNLPDPSSDVREYETFSARYDCRAGTYSSDGWTTHPAKGEAIEHRIPAQGPLPVGTSIATSQSFACARTISPRYEFTTASAALAWAQGAGRAAAAAGPEPATGDTYVYLGPFRRPGNGSEVPEVTYRGRLIRSGAIVHLWVVAVFARPVQSPQGPTSAVATLMVFDCDAHTGNEFLRFGYDASGRQVDFMISGHPQMPTDGLPTVGDIAALVCANNPGAGPPLTGLAATIRDGVQRQASSGRLAASSTPLRPTPAADVQPAPRH